jgi:signal transduction histidine kinase
VPCIATAAVATLRRHLGPAAIGDRPPLGKFPHRLFEPHGRKGTLFVFNGWPIRKKLALGVTLLVIAVSILAISGFSNVYSFRGLVRTISRRATEFPEAVALAQSVSALRATLPSPRLEEMVLAGETEQILMGGPLLSFEFDQHLRDVDVSLSLYRRRLQANAPSYGNIGNVQKELRTVQEMESTLRHIHSLRNEADKSWIPNDELGRETLKRAVDQLTGLSEQLPRHLQEKMHDLQGDVRGSYRAWIILTWGTTISAGLLFFLLIHLFIRWVLRPLEQLIKESRRIAGGEFDHRIRLNSGDEMDELAEAMNDMTERFQQIRDDLDEQVQQRTREVIRGEQLASVGFLAAGVAHEINNPLASIALCAESLEERVREYLPSIDPHELNMDGENDQEIIQDYLRMIQQEAFRCKEITERLLDFSRLGDVEKQQVNLTELVQSVIDMVRHVGKYKQKQIMFRGREEVLVTINPQEMKQVVLNLITNGLESLDPGGTVTVSLTRAFGQAVLIVEDNGCGMSDEVKAHLFEPFFTRRRDGQGTGLGMSISYRIINEHGGQIQVHSDGPNQGSRLTVKLPLHPSQEEHRHYPQAA